MITAIEDLKAKAEVARDLISQGAEEVHITGTDLKVVGKRSSSTVPMGSVQVVNVNAQATTHSRIELSVRLHLVRQELEETYQGKAVLNEISEKLSYLERELAKKNPDKSVLKKMIDWAIDTGWDVFVKLTPIIIDKISTMIS
jgi:hypothetical protein